MIEVDSRCADRLLYPGQPIPDATLQHSLGSNSWIATDEAIRKVQEYMRSRVLLVEDSAPMRQAICRILDLECDLLGWVDDGTKVLEAALDTLPDVIVLDISLPGVSGMTLLPALRASLPAATIIMLTNHASQAYVEEAYRRGADGYVLKSEAHQALLPAISRGRLDRAEAYAAGELLPAVMH